MQFVKGGPDIPDVLVQSHEEGRVVFFCGAGISYPAGLPDYKGLVEAIYRQCNTTPADFERREFCRGQFDVTLDLLERRLPDGRVVLRCALDETLRTTARRDGAIDTHDALLGLGNHGGSLRLVTTNYDRLFHIAGTRSKRKFNAHVAPTLPVPKVSTWNGLVFLHGLLAGSKGDRQRLNQLVVTSGDFGLAYLVERWAARFVSELFRNFIVCFVGYGVNDPILRYMMDALAADRSKGEATLDVFAFGGAKAGEERRRSDEWRSKGVIPIVYEVSSDGRDHSPLHKTLRVWADDYRDGLVSRERIVSDYAHANPVGCTLQDDFVGRMLWALSHHSGLPAMIFSQTDPAPPLEWLFAAFAENRFKWEALARFGVVAGGDAESGGPFSLIRRPASCGFSENMSLVSGDRYGTRWDKIMRHIGRWLCRHLNDPRLLIWIAREGGAVHDEWARQIEEELAEIDSLEEEGKTEELRELVCKSPNGVPGPLMRRLWGLVLAGRIKSRWSQPDFFSWEARWKREGLTARVRLELRELLAPRLLLSERYSDPEGVKKEGGPERASELFNWEVVLSGNYTGEFGRDLKGENWTKALGELLEDFQVLVRDALDMMADLGEANEEGDLSFVALPSISLHEQNDGYPEWGQLIELLRDSWMAARGRDTARSIGIAANWFGMPYPTFKRLALYAASLEDGIESEQWVKWLLFDDAKWLWSIETRREVFRLLVLRGKQLKGAVQENLEEAILAGPSNETRSDTRENVWRRLAKLNASGLTLGDKARTTFDDLSRENPKWSLPADQSDEFVIWFWSGDNDDFGEVGRFEDERWSQRCKIALQVCLDELREQAQENVFHEKRWREALQIASEEDRILGALQCVASALAALSESDFQKIAHSAARWIASASKATVNREEVLLGVSRRVLDLPLNSGIGIFRNREEVVEPIVDAINHPVGDVTEALLNLCFKGTPEDGGRLPPEIEPLFTLLSDVNVERYRHGRTLLASRLIFLFRLDPKWTGQCLLPLFHWRNGDDAQAVWQGFLWAPRLYHPLLFALKESFLETPRYYEKLGRLRKRFASLLTHAALEQLEDFSVEEFQASVGALPQEGLEDSASALAEVLERAGDRKANYWKHRILPFWKNVWPKKKEHLTSGMAVELAKLSIAAGSEFSEVLDTIKHWLKPIEAPDVTVSTLERTELCARFPEHALDLLDRLIDGKQRAPWKLGACLDEIEKAEPPLAKDSRFIRLRQGSRQ